MVAFPLVQPTGAGEFLVSLSIKLTAEQRRFLEHVPFDNFVYSIHISLKNNYVYVEIPKVACSTIKGALAAAEREDEDFTYSQKGTLHNRAFSPLLTPLQVGDFAKIFTSDAFFKFCFVRNPYERALSGYLNHIARPTLQRDNLVRWLGKDAPEDGEMSFEMFVNAICRQSPLEMDNHWRPQFHQSFQDKIAYDFIGRFERLAEDLRVVEDRTGLALGRYLKDQYRHPQHAGEKLGQYFTEDLRQKIAEKYAADFERFDYSTDLP